MLNNKINLITAIHDIANMDETELAELDDSFDELCHDIKDIALDASEEFEQIISGGVSDTDEKTDKQISTKPQATFGFSVNLSW